MHTNICKAEPKGKVKRQRPHCRIRSQRKKQNIKKVENKREKWVDCSDSGSLGTIFAGTLQFLIHSVFVDRRLITLVLILWEWETLFFVFFACRTAMFSFCCISHWFLKVMDQPKAVTWCQISCSTPSPIDMMFFGDTVLLLIWINRN